MNPSLGNNNALHLNNAKFTYQKKNWIMRILVW
jgi:hypothetical protein